jgi:hypothetical protein
MVRDRDLSAGTEQSGIFREIAVKDPRSVVREGAVPYAVRE